MINGPGKQAIKKAASEVTILSRQICRVVAGEADPVPGGAGRP